jgi:hypothetical protein
MKSFVRSSLAVSVLLLLSSCSSSTSARRDLDVAPACKNGDIEAVRRVRLPFRPKYFFKPVWTGDWVGVVGGPESRSLVNASRIGDPKEADRLGIGDQNYLFQRSAQKWIPIPGALDPIGLMGYPLLAVPLDTPQGELQMAFYDVRELVKRGLDAKAIWLRSERHAGRYQSLGLLKVLHAQRIRFRMLTDGSEGGDFQDFEADFSAQPVVVRAVSRVRKLCQNLRRKGRPLNLKLPMISKEGNRIAGFDVQEQKMKVYDLEDNGSCSLVSDAFLSEGDVGKVDFAPGGHQWAFHFSDRSLDAEPSTFGAPRETWQLRSAIYDKYSQSFRVLPFSGLGSNSYFPAFLPGGHVLILESTPEDISLVEYDPVRLPMVYQSTLQKYISVSRDDFYPIQQITDQMIKECYQEPNPSLRSNRLISLLSLSVSQCYSLADRAGLAHGRRWCDSLLNR